MDAKSYIICAIFAAVCLVIYLVSRRMKNEIDEKGIETVGVISRIVDSFEPEDVSQDYYAVYRTVEGEEIEGVISNPSSDLVVGQQVRLKYHPKHKMNARIIR